MAIYTLAISQDNKIGGSDLLSINNPIAFLCTASYSGQTPDFIYCDLLVDGDVVGTYKAIAFKDLAGTIREFIFLADGILKGRMFNLFSKKPIDDFGQASDSLVFVENVTQPFSITFRDPDNVAIPASVDFVACMGASQFGDSNGCNMAEIYSNTSSTYYCAEGDVCYVYFYNDNINNVLSINAALETFYATDFNGDVFTDFNGDKFIVL